MKLFIPFGSTHSQPDAIVARFIPQAIESRVSAQRCVKIVFRRGARPGLLSMATGLTNGFLTRIEAGRIGDDSFYGVYF
jgi:hypothetical protein